LKLYSRFRLTTKNVKQRLKSNFHYTQKCAIILLNIGFEGLGNRFIPVTSYDSSNYLTASITKKDNLITSQSLG